MEMICMERSKIASMQLGFDVLLQHLLLKDHYVLGCYAMKICFSTILHLPCLVAGFSWSGLKTRMLFSEKRQIIKGPCTLLSWRMQNPFWAPARHNSTIKQRETKSQFCHASMKWTPAECVAISKAAALSSGQYEAAPFPYPIWTIWCLQS